MTLAVYPGSFDPFTLGHLDVVRRAATIFDTVIVLVARNAAKQALLNAEERVELARQCLQEMPSVKVASHSGLLVDYCQQVGATAIVKGLRSQADAESEWPMALMNRRIGHIETVFIVGDPALAEVASSLVKDVARHGGPLDGLVSAPVADALTRALGYPLDAPSDRA